MTTTKAPAESRELVRGNTAPAIATEVEILCDCGANLWKIFAAKIGGEPNAFLCMACGHVERVTWEPSDNEYS